MSALHIFRRKYILLSSVITPLLPAIVFLRVPWGQADKRQSSDAYRRRWGEGGVSQ